MDELFAELPVEQRLRIVLLRREAKKRRQLLHLGSGFLLLLGIVFSLGYSGF